MEEVRIEGGRKGRRRACFVWLSFFHLCPPSGHLACQPSYSLREAGVTTKASMLEKVSGKRRGQAGCHHGAEGPGLGCPLTLCIRGTKRDYRPLPVCWGVSWLSFLHGLLTNELAYGSHFPPASLNASSLSALLGPCSLWAGLWVCCFYSVGTQWASHRCLMSEYPFHLRWWPCDGYYGKASSAVIVLPGNEDTQETSCSSL